MCVLICKLAKGRFLESTLSWIHTVVVFWHTGLEYLCSFAIIVYIQSRAMNETTASIGTVLGRHDFIYEFMIQELLQ